VLAAVAALMFAIDEAHAPAVGWIASHNTLLAGAVRAAGACARPDASCSLRRCASGRAMRACGSRTRNAVACSSPDTSQLRTDRAFLPD
jgi:hypothetical protein